MRLLRFRDAAPVALQDASATTFAPYVTYEPKLDAVIEVAEASIVLYFATRKDMATWARVVSGGLGIFFGIQGIRKLSEALSSS